MINWLIKLADIEDGDEQVKADALRIGHYKNGEFPTDSREFAKRIFYTVYMGTENRYSSEVISKTCADCYQVLSLFFAKLLFIFLVLPYMYQV